MYPFGKFRNNLKILGFFLLFYALITNYLWREADNFFWICHVSAFLFSGSLIFEFKKGIQIGGLWLILGTILWLFDEVLNDSPPDKLSYITHFLYSLISIYCFRKIGLSPFPWAGAFLWYVFVQLLSLKFTDPAHNINLVYSIWPPWDLLFSNYIYFLIFMNLFILGVLFFSSYISNKFADK